LISLASIPQASRIVCTLALAAVLTAISSRALEPSTPLANLNRQSWVMENGLPQNTIQALAQTADGFLWLGTEAGLVRFDGVQFAVFDRNSRPALPGNDIRCLHANPDGALLVETADGTVLFSRGSLAPSSETCSANELQARYDDGHGTGWSAVANQGSVTLTAAVEKMQLRLKAGKQLPGNRIQSLLADSHGALWIGTNRGLARLFNGKLDRLPVTDPLATASVLNLLEDREGNLWVGTETSGLHVLRDQRFSYIGAREGLTSDAITAVTQDATGKLWIGTNGGGLNALRLTGAKPGEPSAYALHFGLLSKVILSLAAAPNGSLWVGTPDGLNRVRGSAIDAYTSADGLPDDFIRSLLVDKDGSLWIGTRRGLAHWSFDQNGKPGEGREITSRRIYTTANGLGSNLVGALTRDTHGDLWIATLAGLSRLHAGKITTYTTANGLSSSVITALLARPDGTLLIGTEDRGWNLWNGSRFLPVSNAGTAPASVHAILGDGLGHLWLTTGSGIARCDALQIEGEVKAAQAASCHNWVEFGPSDGLRSRETAALGHPSAIRIGSGSSASETILFATPRGLLTLSPASFPVNSVPPPVVIERFAIDDADQALQEADSPLRIPSGKVHFQFDYAALSFTAPQKVRYRYMLEGFDKHWTEAGARRTAYYTNIPPGKYTFRVQAANNDGLWNSAGASLAFELRPHYYQTAWFYAALVLALILLAVVIIRYRLSRAEREFRAVLAERGRIAREIHDTLAQGYVGVSVQLEVLSELLRRNRLVDAEKHLDSTRESVRAGLADARQSIWALRSEESGVTTLPVRLRRVTEQTAGSSLQAGFAIYGAYRPLAPATEQEILRVAQEAIQNATHHANAEHLWVQLNYQPTELNLEIRDDGIGFNAPTANGRIESPQGHYGLTGMRERAESIGATLTLTSAPGEGATVRMNLSTPAEKEAREA
jgi:signal transduction histidine kinase/ligand-binding sensor domain-containing protein